VREELALVRYPEPVLKKVAGRITRIDRQVSKLAQDMLELMYEERGIGLAANQVAVPRQLLVASIGGEHADEVVLVNPTLVTGTGRLTGVEGCLSLPGIEVSVPRYEKVTVRGYDLSARETEIEAAGLLARVLQHEMDHLEGMLIIDKIGPAARIACRGALQALEQQYRAGG